jgi:D-3-phosphoglycerate dehydrogenase / 2-oxoglutarate reductase
MATRPKVLVTDKLDQVGLEILKQSSDLDYKPGISPEELKKIIGDYDALLVRSQTQANREILESANRLKIIGRAGVGVDNIDVDTATEKGIIVVNSPEGNTIAAAEHTVALMMSMARHIPQADKSCKSNKWERANFLGTELNAQILGVVGLGKIGQRVAKVAQALGMKLLGYDPFVSYEKAEELGIKKVELEEIFTQSDFITLHVPKTKDTLNLINKDSIAKMKDGVRIINCARGGLINEQDLADAINSGKVAGAGIDVFDIEPCTESPLHNCGEKVILTPHLGASTSQAQINVAIDVAEQIRDVLKGGVAKSAVNLPGLKPELVKQIKNYLGIAEFMASMLRQIATGVTKEIEIGALGKLSEKNIEGLKLAILKGILSVSLDGVSFVNAPMMATDRKIKVIEFKSEDSGAYKDKLVIKLVTDKETKVIAGTVLQSNIPAIVQIDNYDVNIRPENHSIITFHKDKPGIVAQVSKILWDAKINISGMNLGRTKDSSAVMVISVDGNVAETELKKITEIEGINIAKYVELKGKI